MEHGMFRLTVFFEDPFWVGVFERQEDGSLEACKYTFGAEPRDGEIYELVLKNWNQLRFSPPVDADHTVPECRNPKRMQRQAGQMLQDRGTSTKAQQALQQQREEQKQERKTERRQRDTAEEARRFALRQAKRKEKHRGH